VTSAAQVLAGDVQAVLTAPLCTQAARKINIAKFRAGRAQFLVVTDVAARGIDIPLLDNVINYDFPPQPKLFVHRVGRAARCGQFCFPS
jgi:superfamily II DNA/RNA helicase